MLPGKITVIGLATASFLLMASTGYGAYLTYTPNSADVTIAAGSEGSVPMTVYLNEAGSGSYFLWFVDAVSDNNLPRAWITANPSTTFLSSYWPSASTNLTISIPADASPGVYTGYLTSKAMASHGLADPGPGMLISVTVPSGCEQAPVFEITSYGPQIIWPPNHEMREITVSGRVLVPDGCSIYDIGYSIDDEYGIYTGLGEISLYSDNNFMASILVEAYRKGRDKDGRHYTITLYAEDEAGIGTSSPLEILVPHDRRKVQDKDIGRPRR